MNLPPLLNHRYGSLGSSFHALRGLLGYWSVAIVFLGVGVGGLRVSAKAARFGVRFVRAGVVEPGRVVDIERRHETEVDIDGDESVVEYSSPVVAFRTSDGRGMCASAIFALGRTMATRRNGRLVADSQRGQWQGRTWTPGEAVRVRYLPEEPERFRVEGKLSSQLLWFLPLSLALLSTAIGCTLVVVEFF